ncbi:hypothetical protein MtrunA17_Chr7g0270431 [Medicago truncatula]|uniref:Uncharacterized protein n=1 Tax=Medicago truncatula TaxID=3880 RepID=A0A396H736_MEDTR|nr:hypothetical protein MtrunA17_Chr7g0270431 [Medicago truncatula]
MYLMIFMEHKRKKKYSRWNAAKMGKILMFPTTHTFPYRIQSTTLEYIQWKQNAMRMAKYLRYLTMIVTNI